MNDPAAHRRYEIKKYPNRRFYDVTRSRHVTLSDLHELVRVGNEIFVTDSATGNDITNVVLAQIILEHDPPKLDLFPASLLHQAIQANEQMVRKFIDQYFSRAMDAFVKSRQQFDEYLRRIGVSAMTPMAPFDWVRMLFPNPGAQPAPQDVNPFVSAQVNRPMADEPAPTQRDIEELGGQLAAMREELDRLRSESTQRNAPSGKKPRAKKKGKSG
ncbi:MAG: hypothetical protein IPK83_07245 [Planctomycetes bacterium]|nr:hypothetical protein [Planctomycetota bacterium]